EEPLQIHIAANEVEPELNQARSLFDQVGMFGDHMLMAAAADADANHGVASSGKKGVGATRRGLVRSAHQLTARRRLALVPKGLGRGSRAAGSRTAPQARSAGGAMPS